MKKSKNLIFGSVLVIVLTLFLGIIISWFVGFFGNASDNVKATSITAIVSVSIFSLGRYLESRREAKQRINAEKIGVYKSFLNFISMFLVTRKFMASQFLTGRFSKI